MINKLVSSVQNNWQLYVGISLLFIILAVSATYNLAGLTSGNFSQQELTAISQANSVGAIMENPLYLPHKLLQLTVIHFFGYSAVLLRGVSMLFALVLVVAFYQLARKWFSVQIAVLSTLMLATSAFFLHYARLASPDILWPTAVIGLLSVVWWLHNTQRPTFVVIVGAFILAGSLYLPGMVWFSLLAVAFAYNSTRKTIKKMSLWDVIIFTGALLLSISPLIYSFINQPQLLTVWLGISGDYSIQTLRDFVMVPISVFLRSEANPVFNLGRLPLIDLFTATMVILGSYAFFLRKTLVRTRVLITVAAISWLLIVISNDVSIGILLPVIYLLTAGGVMFLLQQWNTVFPRNPIARSVGLLIIVAAISISVFYNLNRYYNAWAGSPVTRDSFVSEPASFDIIDK